MYLSLNNMASKSSYVIESAPLNRQNSDSWVIGNQLCSRSLITYAVQVTFLAVALLAALTNLILKNGDEVYWTSLLTFTLSAILPNAKVKRNKPSRIAV